ncbi:MAG: hypothetical protein HY080_04615 [Gammaproteobacteria bacterium]|nr:hypothetical protein [Gammaproteobacteria bacterium]
MKWLSCIGVLWCFYTSDSYAAEVLQYNVELKQAHYLLTLEMRIAGKRDQVYAILMDFDHTTQLNDHIKLSKLLFSKNNLHTVRMEAEGCVLFFCKRVGQTQLVTEWGNGKITTLTDPDDSDLAYGQTEWQLTAEDDHTRIHYYADYMPNFWVPPVIGPPILKSRLLDEAKKTFIGVERRIKASHAPITPTPH